ncbi:MAG: hypothetical protein ACQEV0_16010 [Bacillota bacterium]
MTEKTQYEMGKLEAMKRHPEHFPDFAKEEEQKKFESLPKATQAALTRQKQRMERLQ